MPVSTMYSVLWCIFSILNWISKRNCILNILALSLVNTLKCSKLTEPCGYSVSKVTCTQILHRFCRPLVRLFPTPTLNLAKTIQSVTHRILFKHGASWNICFYDVLSDFGNSDMYCNVYLCSVNPVTQANEYTSLRMYLFQVWYNMIYLYV